jgi:hypothetical protein
MHNIIIERAFDRQLSEWKRFTEALLKINTMFIENLPYPLNVIAIGMRKEYTETHPNITTRTTKVSINAAFDWECIPIGIKWGDNDHVSNSQFWISVNDLTKDKETFEDVDLFYALLSIKLNTIHNRMYKSSKKPLALTKETLLALIYTSTYAPKPPEPIRISLIL